MKDAARLLGYLGATIFLGATLAPPFFWTAHAWFPFLAKFDFETFFHRALLIAAVVLLWPFLRISHVRGLRDLDLAPNPHRVRDLVVGVLVGMVPLLCCSAVLLVFRFYSARHVITVYAFIKTVLAGVFAPLIEEPLFRGLILG